jgi:hypothetical protein
MNVHIAGVGKCEHCGAIVCIQNLPAEALDAEWKCPKCEGTLTHLSFGYEKPEGGARKFIGPDREWHNEEPGVEFDLGMLHVIPSRLYLHYSYHWR